MDKGDTTETDHSQQEEYSSLHKPFTAATVFGLSLRRAASQQFRFQATELKREFYQNLPSVVDVSPVAFVVVVVVVEWGCNRCSLPPGLKLSI